METCVSENPGGPARPDGFERPGGGPAAEVPCGGRKFGRVLVTGAAGFVGRHLVRELAGAGHGVACIDAVPPEAAADLPDYERVDLRDAAAVRSAVARFAPDAVVHLAAVSFVPDAASDPGLLWAVNIGGVVNVAEAILSECPKARMLFVSSAQVYGTAAKEGGDVLYTEESPLMPISLYAVSKAADEAFVRGCHASRGLDAVIARPGNHTGPGQSPKFVAISFARQLLDVATGKSSGPIRVGNLDSVRDFSDVRDVVRAYRLMLEKGRSGAVYNVSSGTVVTIGELFERLRRICGVDAHPVRDDAFWRPTDRCTALCTDALRRDTGWKPSISLDQTLIDILASLTDRA